MAHVLEASRKRYRRCAPPLREWFREIPMILCSRSWQIPRRNGLILRLCLPENLDDAPACAVIDGLDAIDASHLWRPVGFAGVEFVGAPQMGDVAVDIGRD